MRLRSKLALFVGFLVVGLLAVNLILVRVDHARALERDLDQRFSSITASVGLMVLPAIISDQVENQLAEFRELLKRMIVAQPDIARIVVTDVNRRALISYPDQPREVGDAVRYERTDPLQSALGGSTYGYVTVVFDLTEHEAELRSMVLRLSGIALAMALLGIAFAVILARRITRPLVALRDGAVEFGKRNYTTRVAVKTRDEVGELAATFNDMAGRIEKQIAKITALQDWSREVASELDRHRVTEVVVKAFSEMGGVSKMSLMILNQDTGMIEIVGGRGLAPDVQNFLKLKVGEGIAGKVVETGKVIRVSSLDDCPEYKAHAGTDKSLRGSLLALPLVAKGRCFGVVNLHEKMDGTSFDASDESILVTLAEIAAVAFENARLYDLAITDGLTKLFIVRYFHQRLMEEIVRSRRTSQPMSLLMLDIDHFKEVNDTYGHQAGDAALVMLARVVHRVFREVDIPCRYGGEEFAIILPNTDAEGAKIVAERFRETVEKFTFSGPSGELHMTISIGLTTYSIGKVKDELIHESDAALYYSKRRGRNRVTHFLEM